MDFTLSSERQRRLVARLIPLVALAVVAFAAGLVAGAGHKPRERLIAERFVDAWEDGEIGSMYELLDAPSREEYSVGDFRSLYQQGAEAATLVAVRATGRLEQVDDDFTVPMEAETRLFGTVGGDLAFTVTTDADDVAGVEFARRLVFPGLRDGEELTRAVEMPRRAAIKARDGTVLAAGRDRIGDIPELGIVGSVGPIPEEEADAYTARGYPTDATIGISGLEQQFETQLAGTFGGTLSAGARVLAQTEPVKADAIKTSIDLDVENAAVTALAGRLGGVAVTRPATGEVLALAGYDCCAPQPPGSTFKIITLSGALEEGAVEPDADFPVQTEALLSGVPIQNANGEYCGGSLEESFAESCNSVFAPLGAKLGAEKLVATAEKFGFNQPWDVVGQDPGAIPAASAIGDDLAIGSSAIGQAAVTSLPLGMAMVAGVIANDGERVAPVFSKNGQGERTSAISSRTARTVTRFMRAVVEYGTGTAAAIEGVDVAGKTGTAELTTTVPDPNDPTAVPVNDPSNTDAWFVAFAPAQNPKVVVSVLLVGQGAGGATAAPAARTVLEAAL